METPIPNFYFMGVQFIHLLALALWVGGIVIIHGIVAPSLSTANLSPELYNILISRIFRRFHQMTLFCAAALIVTGIIKFWRWENLTPWNSIRYFSISIMVLVSAYMAIQGKNVINRLIFPSKTVKNSNLAKWHTGPETDDILQSDVLVLISFICGLAAILMA